MKQIHRYILANFLVTLFFSIFFGVFLFFLSDFFGHLSSFLKNSVGIYAIAKYYFFYTPFVLYYSAPLIFALSNLITLGYMSMRNEIIVMRSSGISIFKISMPILLLSLIFGILMFASDELVVSRGLDKAYYIKEAEFASPVVKNVWDKKSDMFINISSLNTKSHMGMGVKIYFVNNHLYRVIYADKIKIEKNRIVLNNVEDIKIDKKETINRLNSLALNVKIKVEDFLQSPQKTDYSLKELIYYVKQSNDKPYYYSILMFKVFYPLSPFVLTFLSLVFVLRITPRKSDFVKNVFFGSITFIFFVGSFAFITSMGKMSIIHPISSVVIFMLFWLSVSMYNLLKLGV